MPVRIMSDAELIRFEVLRDVDHERIPARIAAQVLGLTERQVWRLLKGYGSLTATKCCFSRNRRNGPMKSKYG